MEAYPRKSRPYSQNLAQGHSNHHRQPGGRHPRTKHARYRGLLYELVRPVPLDCTRILRVGR